MKSYFECCFLAIQKRIYPVFSQEKFKNLRKMCKTMVKNCLLSIVELYLKEFSALPFNSYKKVPLNLSEFFNFNTKSEISCELFDLFFDEFRVLLQSAKKADNTHHNAVLLIDALL